MTLQIICGANDTHWHVPSTHNTRLAGPHVQAPERESSVTHDSASQVGQETQDGAEAVLTLHAEDLLHGMEATHATLTAAGPKMIQTRFFFSFFFQTS